MKRLPIENSTRRLTQEQRDALRNMLIKTIESAPVAPGGGVTNDWVLDAVATVHGAPAKGPLSQGNLVKMLQTLWMDGFLARIPQQGLIESVSFRRVLSHHRELRVYGGQKVYTADDGDTVTRQIVLDLPRDQALVQMKARRYEEGYL